MRNSTTRRDGVCLVGSGAMRTRAVPKVRVAAEQAAVDQDFAGTVKQTESVIAQSVQRSEPAARQAESACASSRAFDARTGGGL